MMKSLLTFFLTITPGLFHVVLAQTPVVLKQDIVLITLGVDDLSASADFYSGILGWTPTGQSSEAILFYELGGVQLCLYPKDDLAKDAKMSPEKSGFPGFTLSHYVSEPGEVDSIFKQLEMKDVEISVTPSRTDWGGYRGYFRDPDGYHWEVVYNPFDDSWKN